MAGTGRKFTFHGAFSSKVDARRKERQVHGFIRPVTVKGQRRFMVMTRKQGRSNTGGGHTVMHVIGPGENAPRRSGGSGFLWLLLIGGGLWALSARTTQATTRPSSVPLTATPQLDLSGTVVAWYLVNADGTTTTWTAQGLLEGTT